MEIRCCVHACRTSGLRVWTGSLWEHSTTGRRLLGLSSAACPERRVLQRLCGTYLGRRMSARDLCDAWMCSVSRCHTAKRRSVTMSGAIAECAGPRNLIGSINCGLVSPSCSASGLSRATSLTTTQSNLNGYSTNRGGCAGPAETWVPKTRALSMVSGTGPDIHQRTT